jgi:hypothetical protein
LLFFRDDKPTDEGTPWGEQEELEQRMLKRVGAKSAVAKGSDRAAGQEQFDFVFDEAIDFVALDAIKGDINSSSRCSSRSECPYCKRMRARNRGF